MPGRIQPTVELDVPKSMPQARAGDGFFMSIGFRLKNGRAVYATRVQMRRPTIC
jgi:hypothetical protein